MSFILNVQFLRDLFHFSPLHATEVALCAGAGLAGILWFELLKLSRWSPLGRGIDVKV